MGPPKVLVFVFCCWHSGFGIGCSKSDSRLLQVRYTAAPSPRHAAALSPCLGCSRSDNKAALGPCSVSAQMPPLALTDCSAAIDK